MKRLGKKLPVLVVPVLLSLALTPELKAQGGSLDFASSVTPQCVGNLWGGSKCEYVQFTLDVIPDIYVQLWNLTMINPAWTATSVETLVDGGAAPTVGDPGLLGFGGGWFALGTTPTVTTTGLPLKGDPLTMVVRFSDWGSTLGNMQYSWTGSGNLTQVFDPQSSVSFSGTVAPEPVSIALLGTGLLGLGLIARRREKEDVV